MLIDLYKKNESIQIEVTICKPDYNRTPISILSTAYSTEYTGRFGSIDELKFQIPREINDKEKNEDYDLVKGDFILLVELDDRKQYFIIKECDEVVDGKEIHKEITAYSYEYMFSHKLIRDYNEQKSLSDLLDYIISLFPSWELGNTDAELMMKERTLDVSEQSVLEFLTDVQNSYLCVFEFDTVNRQINVNKLENIGKNRGFVLSESNYAKTINIKPNFSEIITRLKCYGNDNISVHSLNPTGTDYIETFEYYMMPFERVSDGQGGYQIVKHSDYMSDGLCMALLDYEEKVENKKGQFDGYLSELTILNTELDDLKYNTETGLGKLETDLAEIQDQIDINTRAGVKNLSGLRLDEEKVKADIKAKQAEIESKQGEIDTVYSNIASLRAEVKIENNLTTQQIKELDMFIREKTWQDNNYLDVDELYEEGQNILSRLAQPAITFSIDAINFLKCLDCSIDWECIISGLGDIINIEVESLDKAFEVRLVSYTYSENGNDLNLTYSNKSSLDDPSIYLKDLLKEAISTSTTLNINKVKYGKYMEDDRSTLIDYINNELDLAKQKAFAGKEQEVVIDKRGILLTNKDAPDQQVKLIGDLITFTNNGWNTAGTAISSEGVVAESIYGKIIAGGQLDIITNSGGTFKVDSDGVQIRGANLTITDADDNSVGLDEAHLNLDLKKKVNSALQDNYLTLAESKILEANILQIEGERTELLKEITLVGVHTSAEWTNYDNAVTDLRTYLDNYWIKQQQYPIEMDQIVGMDRTTLTGKLTLVQATNINVVNKIRQTYTSNKLLDFADSTLATEVSKLQNQIDGRIETWFDNGSPTLSNEPALTWTNTDSTNGNNNESLKHLGDLYYDGNTGYAYRFTNSGTDQAPVFQWIQIEDDAIAKALADSEKAQEIANKKRTVFVETPYTPYKIGDLWIDDGTGDLYRCNKEKLSGSYETIHWVIATKYTDDTRAIEAEDNAKTYTDYTTGNLINNTTLSGNLDRWTGSMSQASVVNKDFFGVSSPVQQLYGDGNHYLISEGFEVDPSKAYEVTLWFMADSVGGSDYFGLYAYDESDVNIGIDLINVSDGALNAAASTNPYFWLGDNSPTNTWIKRTAYIMPTGTSNVEFLNLGTNVARSARMLSNTKKIKIRWLNYYNSGVAKNVWVANPKVVEIAADSTAKAVRQDGIYNGVTINTGHGVSISRSDGKVTTMLNATEGITIGKRNSGNSSWESKVFEVDTSGNVVTNNMTANNIVIDGGSLKAGNDTLIDVTTKRIDFTKFDFSFDTREAFMKGIDVGNGNFKVNEDGTVEISGKITMGTGSSISWDSLPNDIAKTSELYSNSDVKDVIDNWGLEYTTIDKYHIASPYIIGGVVQGALLTTGEENEERMEISSNGFICKDTSNRKHGWVLDSDNFSIFEVWRYGDQIGSITNSGTASFVVSADKGSSGNGGTTLVLSSSHSHVYISGGTGNGDSFGDVKIQGNLDLNDAIITRWGINKPTAVFG